MSNSENDKLREEFFDECSTEWRCPYCGDPSTKEWPVCCKENHCSPHIISPDGEILGEAEYGDLDKELVESEFQKWLVARGES